MKKVLITNATDNIASRRVCEKLGARFIAWPAARMARPLKEGQRFVNVFEWSGNRAGRDGRLVFLAIDLSSIKREYFDRRLIGF